eukprot:CAMPEP_0114257298 /NCGR_PEP_ID=MMETSP0058-20121206/18649_1 /TAXON_ID=36894 /ORGANISM="Pyramimonas parkeae, CCMP726" /LENGTH=148 /DNA_ID=CAMNT_0001371997 /DNA_START=101 /DNA_END=548 /DNA_ORIENTATION=-
MDNAGLSAVARLTGVTVDDTRGNCRKCGRTGHLTFQCRNFVQAAGPISFPYGPIPSAGGFPLKLAEKSAAQPDAASPPALKRAISQEPSSSDSDSDSDSHKKRRKHGSSKKKKKKKKKKDHDKEKHKHKKSKKKRRRDSSSSSLSGSD